LIVEDNHEMRRVIKAIVGGLADRIEERGDGREALAAYRECRPDWVLMDIRLPGLDGIGAVRQIRSRFPEAQVVMVTQYDDEDLRRAARVAGACEYVLKDDLIFFRMLRRPPSSTRWSTLCPCATLFRSRWSPRTGSGGGPYLTGTAQTGLLHINIDKESSGIISPRGFRLAAAAGSIYHAAGSSNAPLLIFSAAHTWPWGERNIFGLSADINSYLRANVAQPYRFTLGGPRRLSASSFDEYRGTDTYLARAGYLRRIAALPTGLGQGLYGVIGYEGGEIWSPEQRAILRQDGTVALVGATPLGAVSFGVSIGDAGRRKVFITIGRLF